MLSHLGYTDLGTKVDMALKFCGQYERKFEITGRDTGVTGKEYGDYVLETIVARDIEDKWNAYVEI